MNASLSRHIAVIGAGAAAFADALARHFADVLILPPHPSLDPRTASHPDMLFARVGDVLVTDPVYAEAAAEVIGRIGARIPVLPGVTELAEPYPHDAAYNILTHSRVLYARRDALDPLTARLAAERGFALHSVRQGYAGCSALSCGDLVLTTDPSLAAALTADGAEVLRLSPGGILLPGYDCGFIGGASGFCGDTAIFFGDPAAHPDGARILDALEKRGVGILPLGAGMLCDFGGILCIPEKMNAASCN